MDLIEKACVLLANNLSWIRTPEVTADDLKRDLSQFLFSSRATSIQYIVTEEDPTSEMPYPVVIKIVFNRGYFDLVRMVMTPYGTIKFINRYKDFEQFVDSVLEIFDLESWISISNEEKMILSCLSDIGSDPIEIIFYY